MYLTSLIYPRPLDGDNNSIAIYDCGPYEYANKESDTDSDTMNDAWEANYMLDPIDATDAELDDDGDLYSNMEEFIMDTDPHDSNAYLRVDATLSTHPYGVSFESSSNRQYCMEYTEALTSGTWVPVDGKTNVQGTGTLLSVTDTNTIDTIRSYRLKALRP